MGIHAWCWNLDRAGPIEIVMTQGESELFELNLCKAGLVKGHEEMRWAHTTLSTFDGNKEEIKLFA